MKSIRYLQLDPTNPQSLTNFKDILLNRWRVEEHEATIRFFRSEAYVEDKIGDLGLECLELKAMTNCYQKIKLLRALEAKWCITLFRSEVANFTKLDEATFKMLSHVFKLRRRTQPTQYRQANFTVPLPTRSLSKTWLGPRRKGSTGTWMQ